MTAERTLLESALGAAIEEVLYYLRVPGVRLSPLDQIEAAILDAPFLKGVLARTG